MDEYIETKIVRLCCNSIFIWRSLKAAYLCDAGVVMEIAEALPVEH